MTRKHKINKFHMKEVKVLVPQSCLTLCNPMDCSLSGSWDSLGKNTGVGYHDLLQEIFLTQGSNLHLLHWQVDSLPPSHQGSLCLHAKSLQSCPILCDTMDCSLPGSSVHGILQTRILEWVAMPSSRGSS